MALHSKDMHKNKITIESISTDDIRSVSVGVCFFCIFIIIVQFSFRLWMLKAKPFTKFARNDLKPNKDEWMVQWMVCQFTLVHLSTEQEAFLEIVRRNREEHGAWSNNDWMNEF